MHAYTYILYNVGSYIIKISLKNIYNLRVSYDSKLYTKSKLIKISGTCISLRKTVLYRDRKKEI